MKTLKLTTAFVLLLFAILLPLRSGTGTEGEKANEKTLTLKFLGPDGEPIPGATANVWMNPKPINWPNRNFEAKADQQGTAQVSFEPDKNWRTTTINVKTPGFTPYYAEWKDVKSDPLPDSYTLKLGKAKTVGGIVLDDTGKPLANVKVSFTVPWGGQRTKADGFVCSAETTTDEKGIWKSEIVPEEALAQQKTISFTHPEFQKKSVQMILAQLQPDAEGNFSRTVSMQQGIAFSGTVVDSQGNPIANAVVNGSNGNRSFNYTETKTNEKGDFEFKNWAASQNEHLIVRADGLAPEMLRFSVKENMEPLQLTLKAGKTLRVKIVDENGNPIPKVWIAPDRWRSQQGIANPLFGKEQETDAQGEVVYQNAPEDEITFAFLPRGDAASKYRTLRDQVLKAQEESYTFILKPASKVVGKVIDAKTKEPVSEFRILKGIRPPGQKRIHWETYDITVGHAGAFERIFNDEQFDSVLIKIEAEGYAPKISDEILLSEKSTELEFALEEPTEEIGQGISGLVQNEQGQAVQGAKVALALKNLSPYIQNGNLLDGMRYISATTDEQGRFTLPPIPEEMHEDSWGGNPEINKDDPDFKLIVLHSSGFAQIGKEDFKKSDNTISLQKWGRVEGIVFEGTKPGKNLDLTLYLRDEVDWSKPHAFFDYRSSSDEQGKFVFENVPPGKAGVAICVRFAVRDGMSTHTSSHGENVEILGGKTTTVKLGGVGRPVIGKLALPEHPEPSEEIETKPDWNFCLIRFIPSMKEIEGVFPRMKELNALRKTIPVNIQAEPDMDARQKLLEEWLKTEEGQKFQQLVDEHNAWSKELSEKRQNLYAKQRACPVDSDGNFRVVDVPPGDWTIDIRLDAPPPDGQCGSGELFAYLKKEISLPKTDNEISDDAFDLGTLTLEKNEAQPQLIAVGADAPDFELKELIAKKSDEKQEKPKENQEKTIKLSDYRGKTVILEFWATWCGPCIAKLPELTQLYNEKIKDNEKFELIALSIDDDDETVLDFLLRRDMPWIQLRPGPGSTLGKQYGVSAVPTLLVVGADGKILAVNPNNQQIRELLE